MNCSFSQRFAFGLSVLLLTVAVVVWIFVDTVSKPAAIYVLRSKDLDALGASYGLLRRRWLFGLLCEPDRLFRARLRASLVSQFNSQPRSYR